MTFREKLIILRNENKLSQQELAEKLDVSRQSISRWESGKSVPSATQILNICKVFHLDANDLVDDDNRLLEKPQNNGQMQPLPQLKINRKVIVALIITIGVILLFAVVGLIITIIYAVKDSVYDAVTTVWIVAIPQNSPMIILSVFLAVFSIVLTVLLIYLIRGKKK